MRDVPRHPGVDGRFEDEVAASDPGGISAPDDVVQVETHQFPWTQSVQESQEGS